MTTYSARAAKALGFLKRHYNDIEIYVEDTGNHNMWLKMIRAILPKGARVDSVNLMGGRGRVIDACKLDQSDDGRKKLYIIDADFDYVLNRPKPRLKYLYRMQAYCIENVLIQPQSVVEVGSSSDVLSTHKAIAIKLDYTSITGTHEAALRRLFALYAASQSLNTGLTTIKYSVHRLITSTAGVAHFDGIKIAMRIKEIAQASIRRAGVAAFSLARKATEARAQSLPLKQVISGKDCILPIVHLRLRASCGYTGSLEQLKVHLAKEFMPQYDPLLARRLRMIFT